MLYYLPERSGGSDCLHALGKNTIIQMKNYLGQQNREETDQDNIYQDYFSSLIEVINLQLQNSVDEAFELFGRLTNLE